MENLEINKTGFDTISFNINGKNIQERSLDRYAKAEHFEGRLIVKQSPVPFEDIESYLSNTKEARNKLFKCFKKTKWIMKIFISEYEINQIDYALSNHINRMEKEF